MQSVNNYRYHKNGEALNIFMRNIERVKYLLKFGTSINDIADELDISSSHARLLIKRHIFHGA